MTFFDMIIISAKAKKIKTIFFERSNQTAKYAFQALKDSAIENWKSEWDMFEEEAKESEKKWNIFTMQKNWTKSWQEENFPL